MPRRPPGPCPHPGCPHLRPCPNHTRTRQPWAGSTRRQRLPPDWEARRARTRARAGGRCEITLDNGQRCPNVGRVCDHVVAGDNHDDDNLQWICIPHDRAKSSAEGHAARRRGATRG